MVDGVLLLDEQNRVVDMNEAPHLCSEWQKNMIGQPASVFFRDWPGLASLILGDGMAAETRFDISDGIRWFDIQVSHLLKEELGGRLVMVRDATDRKRQEARLDALNEELVRRNQDLKQYNTEIAQLNQLISGLQTCTGQKEAYAITAEQLGSFSPRGRQHFILLDDRTSWNSSCSWNC
jgi:PAS domain-containing protein